MTILTGDDREAEFRSALDVFELVLQRAATPASAHEIARAIREDPSLRGWLRGKTPAKTVQARISVDILDGLGKSRFFRYAPAVFGLRSKLDAGEYPENFARKYKFWRRRRRELAHSYIACVNAEGTALWSRRGFLPEAHFPLAMLKHLDIRLVERTNPTFSSSLKRLRYYYCFRYQDKVVRYKRSDFDMRHDGRVGSLTIGFDGWVTESHISLFSRIGYDVSSSVYSDAQTIFETTEDVDIAVDFLGFINDESDRRNRGIIALVFVADMSKFFDFEDIRGLRDLEWVPIHRYSNVSHSLESWSQYLMMTLAEEREGRHG